MGEHEHDGGYPRKHQAGGAAAGWLAYLQLVCRVLGAWGASPVLPPLAAAALHCDVQAGCCYYCYYYYCCCCCCCYYYYYFTGELESTQHNLIKPRLSFSVARPAAPLHRPSAGQHSWLLALVPLLSSDLARFGFVQGCGQALVLIGQSVPS
jgi:hypothetical protein